MSKTSQKFRDEVTREIVSKYGMDNLQKPMQFIYINKTLIIVGGTFVVFGLVIASVALLYVHPGVVAFLFSH